jgi:predicted nucleic acid-binding protein
MTTFVDTAIVIYLLDEKSEFHKWSVDALNSAKKQGPVIIPDIAYSELSIGLPSKEATDRAISELALERFPCSDQSLFRAGRAFQKYKQENAGPKNNVLPDFLIGAQAECEKSPLLTNNEEDFVGYFPKITLICPKTKNTSG